MAQTRRLAALAFFGLAACAAPPPVVEAPPVRPAVAMEDSYSLDDYKRRLAVRIVASSSTVFHEPLPQTMKSIVVLHIRIDSRGRPVEVSVLRSNGYQTLERRAVASVVAATPLPAPPSALLDDERSLSFLETFLFRDDDLFQVRSLVGETWKATAASR
jgi:protein TonB